MSGYPAVESSLTTKGCLSISLTKPCSTSLHTSFTLPPSYRAWVDADVISKRFNILFNISNRSLSDLSLYQLE
jgi:hypothetical protein